jgi:hypothetical protein
MTEVPFLAPGCFGSALMFQVNGMTCSACPFSEQCEPVHRASLGLMRRRFGIEVKEEAPVMRRKSQTTGEAFQIPKKVRDLLNRIDDQSLDITSSLRQGKNPFAGLTQYKFLSITCHLLLNLEVPITQPLLSRGFVRSMNWKQSTADAHARMAFQALQHVGAIDLNDGVAKIRESQ